MPSRTDPATIALTRLTSARWSTRRNGMLDLVRLGRRDLVLEYALKETVLSVIEVAQEALFPEPTELLLHSLTVVKGPDASLESHIHLPSSNYLYAEPEVVGLYQPRASRLSIDTIEGLGRAYIRGMAPGLLRQVRGEVETLEQAKAIHLPNPSQGLRQFADQPDSEILSGRSQRTLQAAVAVRRLDHPLPSQTVHDLLTSLQSAMAECRQRRRLQATLTWLLFDVGEISLESVLPILRDTGLHVLPDLATTLLKRGAHDHLDRLLSEHGAAFFVARGFAFWPLIDYLSTNGAINPQEYGRHPTQIAFPYLRALRKGIAPPPWWSWRPTTSA